ncbi:hypothetical protein H6G81_20565 [Scytonema hofmannii FACHB-248]|uniref:Uncharacterized protein n=1 Tax=Scytonema hofmannii FACHB-248 TaxID=1842502 RepID=A0ABR8GTM5_9CYAN|nr:MULTISPECIES: hypothetical protein [Nostocales]MBD2606857.1 hypothetical protein [Scytonema hofmannii FACHB-248]
MSLVYFSSHSLVLLRRLTYSDRLLLATKNYTVLTPSFFAIPVASHWLERSVYSSQFLPFHEDAIPCNGRYDRNASSPNAKRVIRRTVLIFKICNALNFAAVSSPYIFASPIH